VAASSVRGIESRRAYFVLVALVFWWAFAFRLVIPTFTNDDFDHLSKARQVLFGELPERDFLDDGRPLTILASAVAQRISPTLLSEVILGGGAIAVGVAFVFVLSRRLSGSSALGVLAALFTIAMRPRLYNYPKVVLFPMALWLLWRYLEHPSRRRLALLAAMTVVTFLFRYDLGIYVAIVYASALAVTERARLVPTLGAYVALGLLLCAPYLGWLATLNRLQSTGSHGIVSFLTRPQGILRAPVHFNIAHGFAILAPPPGQMGIRWAQGVTAETRHEVEQEYGLDPEDIKTDGRTIRYHVADPLASRLLALVHDRHVEDTSGIDRGTGELLPMSRRDRWRESVPLLRFRAFKVFPADVDAQNWLYLLFTFSTPLALLALWLMRDSLPAGQTIEVLSLVLMCVIVHQFLIYDSPDSRLPDVAAPTAVLLAWLVRRGLDGAERLRNRPAWIGNALPTAILLFLGLIGLITVPATTVYSDTSWNRVLLAGVQSPATLAHEVRSLGRRPIAYWADSGITNRGLIDYTFRCTSPDDRPFVMAYAPEVYYVSERLFPGGLNEIDTVGYIKISEAMVMRRLAKQSVPVVVLMNDTLDDLRKDFPDVTAFVADRYEEVRQLDFGEGYRTYHILVEKRRPVTRVEPRWGLPCFLPAQ
jgi:hypothetical protein